MKRGGKELVAGRLTVALVCKQKNGEVIEDYLDQLQGVPSFSAFKTKGAEVREHKFPGVENVLLLLSKKERASFEKQLGIQAEKKRKEMSVDDGESNKTPNFSLNELARLLVILRDNEHARNAARAAINDSLDKKDHDKRIQRDHFWQIVAREFNNRSKCHHSFTGVIDDIDPNLPPLVMRGPTKLKEAFYSARNAFAVPRRRWKRSGVNDSADFDDCMMEEEKLPDKSLNVKGKRPC